jgi:hypothetical protein
MGVDREHTYYHAGGFLNCFSLQVVQSPMVIAGLRAVACSRLRHILLCWGIGAWLLLGCLLRTLHHPMALLSIVETCSVSALNWCCLTVLLGGWGRKTRCLLILPLELTSSWLIVLAILMLVLRILPFEMLLLRWALVLPKLLRWIARETRAIAASRLRSTDLTLAILHLFTLSLYHDCSVNQVLERREGMIHQLILQRVD